MRRLFPAILVLLFLGSAIAASIANAADTIMTNLPDVVTPSGSDIHWVVQGGVDKNVTTNQILSVTHTPSSHNHTEADVTDLTHTTNTNASTICTGTDVYLDGEGNCDTISGGGSGSMTTVKEEGLQIGDSDIVTIDFDGTDFNVAETPDTEVNITIVDDGHAHTTTSISGLTEADITDLSHTTDTNANTICTGTNVYLDGEGNCDTLGGGGSGTMTTVKEEGLGVGDADIVTLDFLGADFDVTESPDTEINIVISSAIARDTELTPVDDTPNNGDTTDAVSSNWAYDHEVAQAAHYGEVQVIVFDFTTDTATGDGGFYFHIGKEHAGKNLTYVHAEVITAGTTGTTDVQIHNVTQAADMLTTKLTVDSAETGSDTAATAAVIDTANDDVAENDVIRVDVDAVSTTAAKGLLVTMGFALP